MSELGLTSASFQWTGSTPAGFQKALRAAGVSLRQSMSSFDGMQGRLWRNIGALLQEDRALLTERSALLMECWSILIECRALLMECRGSFDRM